MTFTAIHGDTYGTHYVDGDLHLIHYAQDKALGFGIECARIFKEGNRIHESAGEGSLQKAVDWATWYRNRIPEMDLPRGSVER